MNASIERRDFSPRSFCLGSSKSIYPYLCTGVFVALAMDMIENDVIEKRLWPRFFNFVSKYTEGSEVELEITSLEIGNQVAENWVYAEGISYDTKADVLYIHTVPFEHSVIKPQEVVITREYEKIKFISIKDIKGTLQIIQFRQPYLLES